MEWIPLILCTLILIILILTVVFVVNKKNEYYYFEEIKSMTPEQILNIKPELKYDLESMSVPQFNSLNAEQQKAFRQLYNF
jgi:hypothetical protein